MNKNNEKDIHDNITDEKNGRNAEFEATAGEADQGAEAEEKSEKTADADTVASQVTALNDKYLRLYSEFENYRRRTAREKLDMMSTAGADIVRELLPVLDDFDRAIQSLENVPESDASREGMILIQNKLLRTLEQKGLSAMDAKGKEFDTEYHEAITNIPAPTPDQKGKVVDVAEKGYFFKDKVLRFAKVIVGQ